MENQEQQNQKEYNIPQPKNKIFITSSIILVIVIFVLFGFIVYLWPKASLDDQQAIVQLDIDRLQSEVNELKSQLANSEKSDTSEMKGNSFDLYDVEIGDKVGSMTVEYVGKADEFLDTPFSESNALIKFSGQVDLTGEYSYHFDEMIGREAFCLRNLDEASKNELPILTSDTDNELYFCNYDDIDEIKKLFSFSGYETGRATILIDQYAISKLSSNSTNKAKVVDLISKNNNDIDLESL